MSSATSLATAPYYLLNGCGRLIHLGAKLTAPYPKVLLRGAPKLQLIKEKCIIEELSQRTLASNTSEDKRKT